MVRTFGWRYVLKSGEYTDIYTKTVTAKTDMELDKKMEKELNEIANNLPSWAICIDDICWD